MTLIDRLGGDLPRGRVTVELDDIQATVLRYRPEPYYGTHVMLHVDDAQAGREFLRRLTPMSIPPPTGGRPASPGRGRDHLRRAGGAGRAAGVAAELPGSVPGGDGRARRPAPRLRASTIRSTGSRRSAAGTSTSASASSATPRRRGAAPWTWRDSSTRDVPASPCWPRRTSAPSPAISTRSGYKDSIGQPAIEGSGVEPLPGQGQPIKAGEFILGYPGEAGVPLPMPQPDVLGRNGTYVGLRKYQSRVGAFNRFLQAHAQTERRAGTARREAGGALAQRRAADARAGPTTTRRSAPTRCGTTTSLMPPTRTAGRCRSAPTCGA